jgi:molybdopterin converting factor small subunit
MAFSLSEPTRREALGRILLTITGASVAVLGASGLLVFLPQNQYPQSGTKSSATSTQPSSVAQLFINIQVYYVGMTNLTGTSMENMQISAPATLSNLITEVCQEHPAFQTMSSMQILLNGTAPQGNPMLKNGDTVAFLATMVGG